MNKIVGTQIVEVRLPDGTMKEMIQVNRINDVTGLPSSDTVEIGSIYDPTSPNYDAVKDAQGE